MILAKFWKNFYEINFDFYKTAKFCTKSFVPNFGKIRKTLYFLKKKLNDNKKVTFRNGKVDMQQQPNHNFTNTHILF